MLKLTPTFANPPLTEVVCGVTFKRLSSFAVPHVGLLWQEYQPDYPLFKEMPPLEEISEGSSGASMTIQEITTFPLPLFWFMKTEEDAVIQFQPDRFLHNWKAVNRGKAYPRFEQVYENFETALNKLDKFVTESELGRLDYTGYELTYSNTIGEESGYEGIESIVQILPGAFAVQNSVDQSSPTGFRCFSRFDVQNCQGMGVIEIRTFRRRDNQKAGLQLVLTVKGAALETTKDGRMRWFQVAREWISSNFAGITSDEVQTKYWGRVT